jgi:hypothetical protein
MNSNDVPDFTTKAKAKRASEKAEQLKEAAAAAHHATTLSRTEIYDYAPPCIKQTSSSTKSVPRGSKVGHIHTPSLVAVWKQLDNIY